MPCHHMVLYKWVLFHYVVMIHCTHAYEPIFGPPQIPKLMQSYARSGLLDPCLWNKIMGCPDPLSPCHHMLICVMSSSIIPHLSAHFFLFLLSRVCFGGNIFTCDQFFNGNFLVFKQERWEDNGTMASWPPPSLSLCIDSTFLIYVHRSLIHVVKENQW